MLDALIARVFTFCGHKAQVEAAARNASRGPTAPGGARTSEQELVRLQTFSDSWPEEQITLQVYHDDDAMDKSEWKDVRISASLFVL